MSETDTPQIVDSTGRPARTKDGGRCPQCRAPKAKRVASSGFGQPGTLCGACGHNFQTPWREDN